MSIEGDDGDIPWDQPLELRNILNAPAVVRTNAWKDVGLELGVEEHELDRIGRDCRGLINDCKREMFSYWLKNDLQTSWEKVSGAVRKVKKRLEGARIMKESKECVEKEGNKALNAIIQVKKSLEMMDDMNRNIVDNQNKLEDLKEQKGKWKSSQTQWKREDEEWEGGAERRQQTREALEAHNLQESQFVKRFLREKELSENLSDEEVECYLRKDLLEKELARSKQMRSRHQQAQKHRREVKHLLHG